MHWDKLLRVNSGCDLYPANFPHIFFKKNKYDVSGLSITLWAAVKIQKKRSRNKLSSTFTFSHQDTQNRAGESDITCYTNFWKLGRDVRCLSQGLSESWMSKTSSFSKRLSTRPYIHHRQCRSVSKIYTWEDSGEEDKKKRPHLPEESWHAVSE